MGTQVLSRKEFYDLVWSKPMSKLAKLYGLSDVGLAKICRRHNIPRPPRGYWAKRRVGRNPRKTPLPDPNRDEMMRLQELTGEEQKTVEQQEEAKAQGDSFPAITVAESLRGAHKIVSAANEQFQEVKTDQSGLLPTPTNSALHVLVSRASLRRALLIVDAILKAAEQRGYQVAAGPTIQVAQQNVSFTISEKLEIVKKEADDIQLDGDYVFHHSRFNETRKPSGNLILKLDDGGAYWAMNARHTWRDTDKHKIETRLDAVLAAIVTLGLRKKEHIEEQERRKQAEIDAEKKRKEVAAYRTERRKLQKAEQARVDSLLAEVKNWRQCKHLRAYIEARLRRHVVKHGSVEPNSEFSQWLEWARQQADRLDPFASSPPSILDEDLGEEEAPRTNQWSWYNR